MTETITLAHGAGGSLTRNLMRSVFFKYLQSPELSFLSDAAHLELESDNIAFTTDNFVVSPIFFPGGDLGKLAVCGTVNDLSVSVAEPKYISVGIIVEEGYPIADLERLAKSMADVSFESGVKIVCSDIKAVERGKGDGVFINTAGVGIINGGLSNEPVKAGDKIITSGTMGEHEIAVVAARHKLRLGTTIKSDVAPLNSLIRTFINKCDGIKAMSDPTQGGLVTLLHKWVESNPYGIRIFGKKAPISPEVKSAARLLGLNPFYLANQGRVVLICAENDADKVVSIMRKHPLGKNAAIIGEIAEDIQGKVILQSDSEGEKILEMRSGEGHSRVC